jgi:hypothetical protein
MGKDVVLDKQNGNKYITSARFEPGDAPRIGFGNRKVHLLYVRFMSLEKVRSAIILKLPKAE